MNEVMGTRVLVTGGSGFIGTNQVGALLEAGARVLSIDKKEPIQAAHRDVWQKADVANRDSLMSVFKDFDPEEVFHLGARTDLDGATVADYSDNPLGARYVCEASNDSGRVRRVIFASSRLVCKIGYQPTSEEDTVRTGRFVQTGRGCIRKSFGYVGKSVFQLQRLMGAPSAAANRKTYYIGDYEPIELGDLARRIAAEFDVRAPREVPPAVLRLAAYLGDALSAVGWARVPLTSFRLDNLLTEMLHDFSDLPEITGPLPFSVDEGIRLRAEWMRSGGVK